MSNAADAAPSRWTRAAPTFTRGLRAVARFPRWLVHRHPRWVLGFTVITVGCGGLWLADYISNERQALRRVAALGGWTGGPKSVDRLFGNTRSKPLLRLLGRIPSKQVVTGLVLEGKQPTDADLAMFIRAFPHIEHLDVSSTPITDESMDAVVRIRMLSVLSARNTVLSDEGVAKLSDSSQLWMIQLDGTRITDRSLGVVAELPNLQRLSVGNTQVTDAGLSHFNGKQLRWLDISETKVTEEGVAAFREANPGCVVVW